LVNHLGSGAPLCAPPSRGGCCGKEMFLLPALVLHLHTLSLGFPRSSGLRAAPPTAHGRLQLEGVLYACTKHLEVMHNGSRAGFFIGDGAGVGKGRQICGIITVCGLLGCTGSMAREKTALE
jgi:hypothetical protein